MRPHKGQQLVARRVRALLDGHANSGPREALFTERNRVQDAYSVRCTPQVHGICNDTLDFVASVIDVEINSATDNPVSDDCDCESESGCCLRRVCTPRH